LQKREAVARHGYPKLFKHSCFVVLVASLLQSDIIAETEATNC